MAIQKITIEQFIELSRLHPVLDVRSPGEYNHAHIPGAFNLPLFSDEERKEVGTAFKQRNRETAIKIGLDYFGVKMKAMVEAERYDGPSIVIAYSHCIAHGIDMSKGLTNQDMAVKSGHWLLYRWNPRTR